MKKQLYFNVSIVILLLFSFFICVIGCGGNSGESVINLPGITPHPTSTGNFPQQYSIEEINQIIASENLGWQAGDNPIYRLSDQEFKSMLGEYSSTSHQKISTYISPKYLNQSQSLDPNFSWQYMTSVKNQGGFGSCVSFATIGVIEALIKEKNKSVQAEDLNFSERVLHFLHYPHNSDDPNAEGWFIEGGAKEVCEQGVVSELVAPYGVKGDMVENKRDEVYRDVPTGINYIKIFNTHDNRQYSLSWSYVVQNVSNNEQTRQAIKQALLGGPCLTRMLVSEAFQSYYNKTYGSWPWTQIKVGDVYKSGKHEIFDVLRDEKGEPYGHAVILLGWDDSQQCWICKNSWGTEWGIDGYFKIGYGELDICQKVIKITLEPVGIINPPSAQEKIYFVRANDIYTINPDGTGETKLTNSGNFVSPVLSPDGKKIVFVSNPQEGINGILYGKLGIANSDGSNVKIISNYDYSNFAGADWFLDSQTFRYDKYIIDLNGTKIKEIPINNLGWPSTKLSPDGTKIVYATASQSSGTTTINNTVLVSSINGTNTQSLLSYTTEPTESNFLANAWAPNGKELAVSMNDSTKGPMLWYVNLENNTKKLLVNKVYVNTWTRDGKKIIYGGNRIINSDGTGDTQLVSGYYSCLSPDGKNMIYSSNSDLWVYNFDTQKSQKLTSSASALGWVRDGVLVVVN